MEKSQLIESISGLRGYGPGFLERVMNFSKAYSIFYKQKGMNTIVFGRDTRPEENKILERVKKIYLNNGCDFIDVGITPTPTVQLIAKDFNVLSNEGTASHNPNPWIGIKYFDSKGIISLNNLKGIQKIIKSKKNYSNKSIGKIKNINNLIKEKIPKITNNKVLDYHIFRIINTFDKQTIDLIRQKHYKVVVDHVRGAGYIIIPSLLKYLGCEVIQVYRGKPKKCFPRKNPEPTPNNLQRFTQLLKKEKIDIGFAVDPDVDRLILGSKGICYSEEYTLAIAIKYFTEKYNSGVAITNLSTSRMGEDIIKENKKWKFFRTPVGERNVLNGILKHKALIGGEGNGGIINPKVSPGRDAIYGIVLVLAYMVESSQDLNSIIKKIPKYYMSKIKIPLREKNNIKEIISQIKKLDFSKNIGEIIKINEIDGLRIDYENSWFHLRISNTEPIIRLIVESKSKDNIEELIKKIKSLIE